MTVDAHLTDLDVDIERLLDGERRAVFAAIADFLIPDAHGMPSAGAVVGARRLAFVLRARPDLVEPLRRALSPEVRLDPAVRLEALRRDDPVAADALLLTVVGGYYTDRDVRERIGYPGQLAKTVNAAAYPEYLAEGLIDGVVARGPIYKDPATGRRAERETIPAEPQSGKE